MGFNFDPSLTDKNFIFFFFFHRSTKANKGIEEQRKIGMNYYHRHGDASDLSLTIAFCFAQGVQGRA